MTLDVREDIAKGDEPFARIMGAVAALRGDQQLRLIAPFEPLPLLEVMAIRGFTHKVNTLANGDYEVLFHRHQFR